MLHPPHRAGQSGFWAVAAVVGWAALLVAVLALWARTTASSTQLLIVVAAMSHFLLAAAPVAVAAFAMAQRWRSLVVALIVFVLAVLSQAGLYLGDGAPSSGDRLIILQGNVHQGAADATALVHEVRAAHADLITLEEINTDAYAALQAAGLSGELPYVYAPGNGYAGVGIWSRYPLVAGRDYTAAGVVAASAQVQWPGRPFTVVAAHPPAPYPAEPTPWLQQVRALRTVLASLRSAGGPVVVGGDLNGTVDNAQIRKLLRSGYADGAAQSGAGYLPTFPVGRAYPPFSAIDHVLTSDGAATVSLRRVNLRGSDHRGLLGEIRLAGSPS